MSTADAPHLFEAKLTWTGGAAGPLRDQSYARAFRGEVAGKPSLDLSGAAQYGGDASRHNPEDLLVLSLSACHALTYLSLCAKYRIVLVAYEDQAVGELSKVERSLRFTKVTLRPRVLLAAGSDRQKGIALHADAHRYCFIANSVSFPVVHEPEVSIEADESTGT